jgi:hypothetical protein
MSKFRKKPVVIEAFQVPPGDGDTRRPPPLWMANAMVDGAITLAEGGGLEIKTLEGTMRADVGDWVIQGIKGELYPCKPDIFESTYEPA